MKNTTCRQTAVGLAQGRRFWFAILPIAASAVAQSGDSYRLDWSTVDAGGGTSRGGEFQLSGTIGQPDAALLHGGQYRMEAGFWSGVTVVQVPGAPILRIRLVAGNQAVISWPVAVSGFTLEYAPQLDNENWTVEPTPELLT